MPGDPGLRELGRPGGHSMRSWASAGRSSSHRLLPYSRRPGWRDRTGRLHRHSRLRGRGPRRHCARNGQIRSGASRSCSQHAQSRHNPRLLASAITSSPPRPSRSRAPAKNARQVACEEVRSRGSGFWLAGRFRRSPAGPDAHSFNHRGRKEDQRGCYGTQAHRYERGARSGPGIRSGEWWRWVETERFRHVMPPENLKVDGVPAEYPDDAADPPQPSHPQISGSCCQGCMDLVYHGCWLPSCSPAMPDDRRRLPGEDGQDEEVLQNLSMKRSNATSCNSSRTPREQRHHGGPTYLARDS